MSNVKSIVFVLILSTLSELRFCRRIYLGLATAATLTAHIEAE
jgi:hypothetical protein